MAFYFSRRKLKIREDEDTGELNVVPYLDILMNLIIFMLLSMTGLASFGILNVNAPSYGSGSGASAGADAGEKLLLSVGISKRGFYIAGAEAVLGAPAGGAAVPTSPDVAPPTIPLQADGKHNFPALTELMVRIKSEFPQETKVMVGAEAEVPYETLIETMDSIRETSDRKTLFSDVTLNAM